ncbi:hypothetical protein HYH03_002988 [Edaphochlamys debaryana]|uniref:Uncharacterized protein n=1 Tax=Edaphochlamys debaryana TaxID=47281 RepID=A0A835YIV9_9CHLO|nr:hypothetical protein HYH03_002988 [Edaphochlamys debaryana]|eukprot:KAG2499415.1 hypothetical protein HYH03_002988 [Edaphochlamys debaryana]
MGPRKQRSCDDDRDDAPKAKKPSGFWSPFNTWWREHHERTGNRATVVEMRAWYAQNAHLVWPADMMPTVDDMLKIAKGLRTIKQVQDYFRSYRKNLKTRKDGDSLSPEGGVRKGGRKARTNAGGVSAAATAAGNFLAAVQQAAAVRQLHARIGAAVASEAVQAATADAAGGSDGGAAPGDGSLQFLDWGFTTEAAAAAAMEAVEAGSDEADTLSESEEGTANGSPHDAASPGGGAATADVPQLAVHHPDSVLCPGDMPMHLPGGEDPSGLCSTGAMMPYPPFFDPWQMQHGPPPPHFMPSAVATRRIVKAVRTSVGGAHQGLPGVRLTSESSGGGAAAAVFNGSSGGMQTVTCRRTRIRTSAGGMWQQEVVEAVEVGMAPPSPLNGYGMPYAGMPLSLPGLPDVSEGYSAPNSAPGSMHPPPAHSDSPAAATAWPQQPNPARSTAGGDVNGGVDGMIPSASAPSFREPAVTELGGSGTGASGPPPRKQRRSGDRAIASVGGSEGEDAAAEAEAAGGCPVDGQSPPSTSGGDTTAPAGPARRMAQSYGGYPGYPGPGGLRHKLPHSATANALSDGGAVYGASASAAAGMLPPGMMPVHGQAPVVMHPSHGHPHPGAAAQQYRAPAGSYGGMPPPAWPHHPHAAPPSGMAPHPHAHAHPHAVHHPGYPPYPPHPMYGYRHPAYSHPAYGYPPHAGHPPAAYPGMPPYHMPMPYHPYGMGPVPHPYYAYPPHGMPGVDPNANVERPQPMPMSTSNGGARPAGAGGPAPLQLADLPAGLLTGPGLDSLSHSDLAGLSGLSALGLAESDNEGDEAATSNHHHHHAHHHHGHGHTHHHRRHGHSSGPSSGGAHDGSKAAGEAAAEQQRPAAAAPAEGDGTDSKQQQQHTSQQQSQDPQVPGQAPASQHPAAATAAANAAAPAPASAEQPSSAPQPPSANVEGNSESRLPLPSIPSGEAVLLEAAALHREARGSCGGASVISGGAGMSDGGAPDGTASVYYKASKLDDKASGLPLPLPLPLPIPGAHEQHAHPHLPYYHHPAHHHAQGDPVKPGPGSRPAPMTIHVMQEDLVVMPGLGLGGNGGDMSGLPSPTPSLNLNLLDPHGGADEAADVAMWAGAA